MKTSLKLLIFKNKNLTNEQFFVKIVKSYEVMLKIIKHKFFL